jgi:hypothetical protein
MSRTLPSWIFSSPLKAVRNTVGGVMGCVISVQPGQIRPLVL